MYNLLRNARIRNSSQCRFDSNLGYAVAWDEADNFRGYTTYSGITARLVDNGYYFMVTTGPDCYITTDSPTIAIDAGVYTSVDVYMRIYPGFGHASPAQGKLGFMTSGDVEWDAEKEVSFSITPDNSYRKYSIDMAAKQEWVGTITRLRLFPMVSGTAGQQIFVRGIEASSPTVFSCSSGFFGDVCDRFFDYSHPCPFRGSGGKATSTQVPAVLTTQSGVNDRLIVDINDYGSQAITLAAGTNVPSADVAKDIESKLNLVGVGGYAFATCTVVDGSFVIEADTPEGGSTVAVSPSESASAAATLGFYPMYTSTAGVAAASRYMPEGAFMVGRDSLDRFYSLGAGDSSNGVFTVTPGRYVVQGGNPEYYLAQQDTTLDFEDETFIDFSNPITENGVISFVGFSGTAHKNTEFRVYRQVLDGTITYVGGVPFNSATDYNTNKLFEASCALRVRKGDLVGLYSASVHTGKDTTTSDFSYFLYEGNLLTSASSLRPKGTGFKGAPLFARGDRKTDCAVITLEFDEPQEIESLYIGGSELVAQEVLQLSKLSGPGYNGGPRVTGYTGYAEDGSKAPEWVGLSAITDGVKLDVNETSASAYPLWWNTVAQSDYDYTEAGIILDLAPGIDVQFNINRVDVYFAGSSNIKHFTLDYPQNTDALDTNRSWQQVTSPFSAVYVDGALSPTTRYFYQNPAVVSVADYHEDYVALKYRHISFRFDSVSTRSIRFRGFLDRTAGVTDYASTTTLADFPIYLNPKIQEIEVYGYSVPTASMQDNFELQSSPDGILFLTHLDKEDVSATESRFTVGYPVKSLKLVIKPTTELSVSYVKVDTSASDKGAQTNAGESEHQLKASKNAPGTVTAVTISNTSDIISNYSISLVEDVYTDENLLLWNKVGSITETQNSEVGPGAIVFKRPNFQLHPHNVARASSAYVLDTGFLGDSPCYITYDSGATWEVLGPLVVNGSAVDGLTNETAGYLGHPTLHIAVDCQAAYDVDSVSLTKFSSSILDLGWSSTVNYSSTNTTDPSSVVWGSLTSNVRWIRLNVNSVAPGTEYEFGKRSLAYISVLLDVFSSRNFGQLPWLLERNLTSGVSGGTAPSPWAKTSPSSYYCIDLGIFGPIIGVVLGPKSTNNAVLDGTSFLETYNDLDSQLSSSYIAFSGTDTSDPSKVRWRALGAPASGRDRWVLVNKSACDEVAVFFDFDREVIYNPLYSSTRWWSSVVSTPQVFPEYSVPLDSVGVIYPARTQTAEVLSLACPLGFDNDLCQRDALSLCLFVSDKSQMDSSFGYIKLWKYTSELLTFNSSSTTEDTSSFFVWDLEDLYPSLVNGWNFLLLPFTLTNEVGDTRFLEDISGAGISEKKRARIGGLTLSFKGTGSNNEFKIALDNLGINRAYYPETSGVTGLYLSGDDYAKFPLGALNHSRGCLEFFIVPDWSKDTNCNSCTDLRSHTIFYMSNQYGYSLLLAMTTSGLRVFWSNSSNTLALLDISDKSLIAGQRSHLAVVWDLTGSYSSILELYINGELSSCYSRESLQGTFDLDGMSDTQLVFGGRGWSGLLSEGVSGLDGAIDNIRLYSYPKRDFSDSLLGTYPSAAGKARDLVELSTDGVSFYGYGEGLPLLVRNVPSGGSFPLYLRGKGLELAAPARARVAFLDVIRTKVG